MAETTTTTTTTTKPEEMDETSERLIKTENYISKILMLKSSILQNYFKFSL